MYKFNISAPGRVFLCGERSENVKKMCVAASLNMRTKLAFTSLSPTAMSTNIIKFEFSTIALHVKISLDTFYENFLDCKLTGNRLHEEIKEFIDLSSEEIIGTYDPNNHEHQFALQTFLYLLIIIGNREKIRINSSFVVKLSTELAIGEGLGSSTSFVVCLTACFLRWSLLQRGFIVYNFGEQELLKICDHAHLCERIIFGSTFLIDTVVSVYGSIAAFQGNVMLHTCSPLPSMKILLVSSNIKQRTITQAVIDETKKMRSFVEPIMNSTNIMSSISIRVFNEIKKYMCKLKITDSRDLSHLIPLDSCKMISKLIHMNQGLLCALGMSHPSLDFVCAIARKFSLAGKVAGSKGGFAFIFLLPNNTNNHISQVSNELRRHNFHAVVTSLCGQWSGVRVE
ncbi:hypothetical protein P5V15_009657 [Pogonomyrmex californicus]